jgi:hypothetical protein
LQAFIIIVVVVVVVVYRSSRYKNRTDFVEYREEERAVN